MAAGPFEYKVDIWAAGMILWFILTTKLPFKNLSEAFTMELIKQERMSDDQFELIEQMTAKQVNRRITAKNALAPRLFRASSERFRHSRTRGFEPDIEVDQDAKSVMETDAEALLSRSGELSEETRREQRKRFADNRYQQGEKVAIRLE